MYVIYILYTSAPFSHLLICGPGGTVSLKFLIFIPEIAKTNTQAYRYIALTDGTVVGYCYTGIKGQFLESS